MIFSKNSLADNKTVDLDVFKNVSLLSEQDFTNCDFQYFADNNKFKIKLENMDVTTTLNPAEVFPYSNDTKDYKFGKWKHRKLQGGGWVLQNSIDPIDAKGPYNPDIIRISYVDFQSSTSSFPPFVVVQIDYSWDGGVGPEQVVCNIKEK